jgi:hypothetical protein
MSDRLSSLLHMYRLQHSQTRRLPARSDLHDRAHVRMRPEDIEALKRAPESLQPMVVLFSTTDASEAVCLRTAETVYVRTSKNAEWMPLRVAASHAYVRGMRVSGTIHRAILRLVRE